MSNHEERMAVARVACLSKAPYFSSVVHAFVFVPVNGLIKRGGGAMACTVKLILLYDTEWAETATIEELAADLAHEVGHFQRRHFARGAGMNLKLANVAADLALNPDLVEAGWKLDPRSLFPKNFDLPDGKTMEEYYELLQQMSPPEEPEKGSEKKEQEPADKGEPQGGTGKEEPPEHGICHGHCGGIAGGPGDPELEQELNDEPGLGRDEADLQQIETAFVNDIKAHVEAKGRGSVPASFVTWAETFKKGSAIRWQAKLASVLRQMTGRMQSGGDDFSLRRPSKRSVLRGFVRPGLIEHFPEVAIIRDTSGSMGQAQLTAATKESYFIMRDLGIDEVWFADADTRVASPWKRVNGSFFRTLKEARGGGGTDFRQPIEEALKLKPRPDLLVYCTDGDGNTTDMPPPRVGVVWVIVPSYYNKPPAPWGLTVIVKDEEKGRSQKEDI